MGVDQEQLDRWRRLVADDPSDPVRAHWSALRAAARSLLVLVEQQADEIARLEAELEVEYTHGARTKGAAVRLARGDTKETGPGSRVR